MSVLCSVDNGSVVEGKARGRREGEKGREKGGRVRGRDKAAVV